MADWVDNYHEVDFVAEGLSVGDRGRVKNLTDAWENHFTVDRDGAIRIEGLHLVEEREDDG